MVIFYRGFWHKRYHIMLYSQRLLRSKICVVGNKNILTRSNRSRPWFTKKYSSIILTPAMNFSLKPLDHRMLLQLRLWWCCDFYSCPPQWIWSVLILTVCFYLISGIRVASYCAAGWYTVCNMMFTLWYPFVTWSWVPYSLINDPFLGVIFVPCKISEAMYLSSLLPDW